MKRLQISSLLVASIVAAGWAYRIMYSLIQVLLVDVTYVDLGSIFFLGLLSGVTAGMAIGVWRRRMHEQG